MSYVLCRLSAESWTICLDAFSRKCQCCDTAIQRYVRKYLLVNLLNWKIFLDALEVCRAGMEAGIQQGQKKRNREIMAWAKKKRKVIKREELLAFLSNKPYRETSPLYSNNSLPETSAHLFSNNDPLHTSNNNSSTFGRTQGPGLPTTCNFGSTNCTSPYHGSAMLSPRRSRSLLRDDPMSLSEDIRDNGRKRQINLTFDYAMEQPFPKRGRL